MTVSPMKTKSLVDYYERQIKRLKSGKAPYRQTSELTKHARSHNMLIGTIAMARQGLVAIGSNRPTSTTLKAKLLASNILLELDKLEIELRENRVEPDGSIKTFTKKDLL